MKQVRQEAQMDGDYYTVRCGECRLILDEPTDLDIAKRAPCPECGSIFRYYEATLEDKLALGDELVTALKTVSVNLSEPSGKFGLLQAEINNVPSVIWDSWKHTEANNEALWNFCKRWKIDLENDGSKEGTVAWVREELRKFRNLIEHIDDSELTKPELEEIVSKFVITVKNEIGVDKKGNSYLNEYRVIEQGSDNTRPDGLTSPFITSLYSSLYACIVHNDGLNICSTEDCNNLIVQQPIGRKKLYCSLACKKRVYRHRKREMANV